MHNKIAQIGSGACIIAKMSLDNNYIIVATVNGFALHRSDTLERIKFIQLVSTPIGIAISPNNTLIAYATFDRRVFLFDLETNKSEELIYDNLSLNKSDFINPNNYDNWIGGIGWSNINVLEFSPDGNYLATAGHSSLKGNDLVTQNNEIDWSFGQSAIIWDITSRKEKQSLFIDDLIRSVCFSPDLKYLYFSAGLFNDKRRGVWNLTSGQIEYELQLPDYFLFDTFFSPDSKQIITLASLYNFINDVQTGNILSQIRIDDEQPTRIKEKDAQVKKNNEKINKLPGYSPKLLAIAISPDNRFLAAVGNQPRLYLWDIETTYLTKTIEFSSNDFEFDHKFFAVDFSPDGGKIMVVTSYSISLWDFFTGALQKKFDGINGGSGKFSPDGSSLAIVRGNQSLSLFSIENGIISDNPRWTVDINNKNYKHSSDDQYFCDFSYNNEYIVTGGADGQARVWDTKSGEWFNKLGSQVRRKIHFISCIPRKKEVIFKTDEHTFLFDCKTGKTWVFEPEIDEGVMKFWDKCIITSDGKYLITNSLSIIDINNMEFISSIEINTGDYVMKCMAASKKKNIIAVSGDYGVVHVLKIGSPKKTHYKI